MTQKEAGNFTELNIFTRKKLSDPVPGPVWPRGWVEV